MCRWRAASTGREMEFDALSVNGRSLWPQGLATRAEVRP